MPRQRTGANRRKRLAEKQVRAATPRRRRRWGPLLGLAAGLGAAAIATPRVYAWVLTSPAFVVRTIEVHAPQGVDPNKVIAAAGLSAGMRITDVHPGRVRANLATYRWARRIDVARKLPDAVEISFAKRQPIAFVCIGRVCCVDELGVLVQDMPDPPADLPLVFGLADTATDRRGLLRLSRTDLSSLKAFLAELRKAQGDLAGRTAQIDLSDPQQARLALDGGRTVVALDRMNARPGLMHLNKLLALIGASPAPRSIDLRFGNLAFVR